MRRTVYTLLLAILFSFLWGVWYGFTPPEEGLPWLKTKEPLRVLAPSGIFTPEFLLKIKNEEGLDLELTEMQSGILLLRELLKAEQAYDLVLFSSFLSDSLILDHYFAKIDRRNIDLDKEVSVDFLQLNFDPGNQYAIPLLWGVNGWLVPRTKDSKTLSLESYKELRALNDPAELFGLATKLKPIVRSWVETGETKQLMSLQGFFKNLFSKKGIQQISSGALTEEILVEHEFKLAQERSHLWIIHGAIAKDSPNQSIAEEALALLLSPPWSVELANQAQAGTVNKRANESETLPYYRKASYIRQLPISQIELFSSHEAYEPIFMSILQKTHPSVFN